MRKKFGLKTVMMMVIKIRMMIVFMILRSTYIDNEDENIHMTIDGDDNVVLGDTRKNSSPCALPKQTNFQGVDILIRII